MKDRPKQNIEREYFRSRIRGNACEYCGHIFEDGEIIFTPEQTNDGGEIIIRYFCGAKMLCLENYKNRNNPPLKDNK